MNEMNERLLIANLWIMISWVTNDVWAMGMAVLWLIGYVLGLKKEVKKK